MPVLLDSGPLGSRLFAATERDRGKVPPDFRSNDPRCVDIGLINNMSDSALEQTERQIMKLLDAAAGDDALVRLKLYALPDVPRGEWGRKHLSRLHYFGVEDLWNSNLDALIVTGAEPRTPELTQEPYWHSLTKVFDWAEDNTISTIASCLAVHAAVYHLDGIGRHSLGQKCFGVFEFEKVSDHLLTRRLPARLRMPHSRWNEIREDALTACGYDVLVGSDDNGVDMFVKARKSLFLFFQGHPEYEPWTLLGEYRRDITRFLNREQENYPAMPQEYFDEDSARALDAFRNRALDNRHQELMTTFPIDLLTGKLTEPWRSAATQTYSNWLQQITERKADQVTPGRSVAISTASPAR